jgi:hypothetical protein
MYTHILEIRGAFFQPRPRATKNIEPTLVGIYRFMVSYLSWPAFKKIQDYVMDEERI